MIAQITLLALQLLSLLMAAHMHGKPMKGTHDFTWTILRISGTLAILYFGGFFDNFFK